MDKPARALLFDWGDTLMADDPAYSGPMVDWPMVSALPGVAETLETLQADWLLAVATNAADSSEPQIRAALERVDLADFLSKIYCYHNVGSKKPSQEFFQFILSDLHLPASAVIMVGDHYEIDILGSNRAGLRAVWLNTKNLETPWSDLIRTVHSFGSIPEVLADWERSSPPVRYGA